jgi:hypothetical protein
MLDELAPAIRKLTKAKPTVSNFEKAEKRRDKTYIDHLMEFTC